MTVFTIGATNYAWSTEPLTADAGLAQGTLFFFQAKDGIRDLYVTGVQTCALPICAACRLALVTTLSIGVIGSPPFARAWDSSRAARTRSIVTLGDSVPRGTNCHCTPYPKIIAARLSETSSQAVSATNDSVAGYTTANVLRQLTTDQTV